MPMQAQSLSNVQASFLSALQQPYDANTSFLNLAIKGNSRMSQMDCLAIYQRSYYSRLLACMREQFPALCHCLGGDLFDDFCKEYLKACKPSSYTLYELGKRFPSYLLDSRPQDNSDGTTAEVWVDFMTDLAQFECAVFSLFDAHGDEGKPSATLCTSDDALALQKCFSLGDYQFDVATYYHGVRNSEDPKLPPLARSKVALVRKEYLTHTLFLSAPHYHFLELMAEGVRVEEALLGVAENFNLPFEQVLLSWQDPEGVRTHWINSGVFIKK